MMYIDLDKMLAEGKTIEDAIALMKAEYAKIEEEKEKQAEKDAMLDDARSTFVEWMFDYFYAAGIMSEEDYEDDEQVNKMIKTLKGIEKDIQYKNGQISIKKISPKTRYTSPFWI